MTARHQGFTLIEVMIVTAIIAILAAVAYPSYQEYVYKGRRAQARTALAELMQQQERFMTQNNTYRDFAAGALDVPFRAFSGSAANDAAGFKLGARACAGQVINECVQVFAVPNYRDPAVTELNMTSTGIKSCTGNDTSRCWR
jgi:type IV pilus assembly protein PilE